MSLGPKERAKLPSKDFGLPEKARTDKAKKGAGNFPMPDQQHAANAKSRAEKSKDAGNLTEKEFERINRKADRIIANKKKE